MTKLRLILTILATGVISSFYCKTVNKTLYINDGYIKPYSSIDSLYVVMFNNSSTFEDKNAFIETNVGDIIDFTIINNQNYDIEFSVENSTTTKLIPANSTESIQYTFNVFGTFQYYCSNQFPHYKALGLSGIIYIHDDNLKTYHWNLSEFDTVRNQNTIQGIYDNISSYQPSYFTINGLSSPYSTNDQTQAVEGSINEEIIICILNSGLSHHSIHFHGYHLSVLYHSEDLLTNASKDTFPFKPGDSMILKLIPDKAGIYPVHDHNLVAVTGNKVYSNGMLQLLKIIE